MTTQLDTRLDRRHWTLAVAAGMASLLDSAAIISVGTGLALWRAEYELTPLLVGVLSSALTLFIAVGSLFGGRIADVLGRGRVFSVTVLLYALGAIAVAVAPNEAVLVTGVVVVGLAAGADLPASLAVLSERAPDGARGRLIAFTHVMWTVGVVIATALSFIVAPLGTGGISLLFTLLAVLAVATSAFRTFYRPFHQLDHEAEVRNAATGIDAAVPVALRTLLTTRVFLRALVLTGLFYLFFTLVANTFGSFKTYFLVTVGGADQSVATGISFITTLVGLVFTVVFTRIADTSWRTRFFYAGVIVFTACQVLIAVTGGTILPVVFAALVLYNVSFPFVGEALYKIWTQEFFPVNARATAQGLTIFGARLVAAGFALITPSLIAWSPTGLYLLLTAFALVSGTIGATIIRVRRHASAETGEAATP